MVRGVAHLYRRLRKRSRLIAGLVVFGAVLFMALLATWIAPHDPLLIDSHLTLRGAIPGHPLGTDEFGRDILSRLIYGARPTLAVASGATLLGLSLGVVLGLVAGFYRGVLEHLIMRSVDTLLCFPPVVLAMMVVGFLGPGVRNLILVIGVLSVPTFARLTYAETIRVTELEFVEGARSLGASDGRILFRHVLPNITAPLIVQSSLTLASSILLESGLSFLGLGVVPPEASWGLMIATARGYMGQAPTYVLWPSLLIGVTILAINTVGDALRDLLDPRLRG